MAGADGVITVPLQAGMTEVLLPANTAILAGERSIVIGNESMTIELTPEAISQLEEGEQGQISIGINTVAVNTSELQDSYNAVVNTASPGYQISFELQQANSSSTAANQAAGVNVSFELGEKIDLNRVAIYKVDENGLLSYVGGTVKDGKISAVIEESGTYVALEFNKSFEDVSKDHWAYEAISLMSMRLVAQGVNETHFAPNQNITRSEFVALIARALGLSASNQETPFKDVAATSWYANEVAIAYQLGLINGKSETEFAPDNRISSEEMAVILLRAYLYATGIEVSGSQSNFVDDELISSWAKADIAAAYELRLIEGRGNNKFAPLEKLTRAEAIQAILNVLN